MQLELYKWLVPLLAIFYIIRTIRQYSLGKYSPRNTIIWIFFWMAIAMLGIMPNEIANSLAKNLGFQDSPNAIIFVSLGLLFLIVFYLSAALNRVENQLTDLVRKLALNEAFQSIGIEEKETSAASPKELISVVKNKNTVLIERESETEHIIQNIKELKRIVNKTVPDTTSEFPESVRNDGKTPKSKSKE